MEKNMKLWTFLFLGAFIQGLGMALFLFPNDIPSGGAAGIAILTEHLFDISHGLTLWIVNVPLMIIALRRLGRMTVLKTIFAVSVTALTVQFMENVFEPTQGNFIIFDLVIGAVIFGVGVGILFKQGASSGGMAMLAQLVSSWTSIPPGRAMFWINSMIFILTAYYLDWMIVLYALAAQLISTRIIDLIYNGVIHIPNVRKAFSH
jgi:uncharacterized membrane-anchored protein YitT (DUF2179 family)